IVQEAIAARAAIEACLDFNRPGSYFALQGGGIGWGLPATLGIKLALPDRPVIGVIGDGSAMYSIQALWTAAHHNIPAVWLIHNNGSYRILKANMVSYLKGSGRVPQFDGFELWGPDIDFAKVAQSFGVHGRRVEHPDEVRPALEEAQELGKPALVDVVVDSSLDEEL
ncbi:MAG: thiamine pyrophosphate-dependent enzyme, partial [Gammaproteobacteria bacterium]|nr:thiamine pyrophosphate-dependent enzyme [Gammaproteobacteria bacterium]